MHVVDCGFSKQRFVHPSGEEALVISPISQASARQRAGRAGRSRPGAYYCLMPESSFDALQQQTPPEMQRCSLAATVLQLKALGVENVLRFDYLSPPPPQLLARALESLYALGALDGSGALTFPHGETMALLPLDPQPAAFLLSAAGEGCEADALTLAAMLSLQSPFLQMKPADQAVARAAFAVYEGDAVTLLNVCRAYARRNKQGERTASNWCKKHLLDERVLKRAGQVRRQLEKHMQAHAKRKQQGKDGRGDASSSSSAGAASGRGGGTTGTDALRRALVRGFFATAARHEGGGVYRSVLRGSLLKLHVTSVLYAVPPDWLVYHETTYSSSTELILSGTKVDEAWLSELAPHFYAVESHGGKRGAGGTRRGPVQGPTMPSTAATSGQKRSAEETFAGGSFAAMLGESLR